MTLATSLLVLSATLLSVGWTGPAVSDDDLRNLSEQMYLSDDNNVADDVRLNIQGKFRPGVTPAHNPLLQVQGTVTRKNTINLIMELFKHEDLADTTHDDRKAELRFIDAVARTPVMQAAKDFLHRAGAVRAQDFNAYLDRIWFTVYKRGGIASSGFKHVFMAEVKKDKNTSKLIVNGLHNWLFYALEESRNVVHYLGWKRKQDFNGPKKGSYVSFSFKWRDAIKETGSMLVGTSPELEMALYTVCFALRQQKSCPMNVGGVPLDIVTYSQDTNQGPVIGTAYPKL